MFRPSLPQDDGMLFVFGDPQRQWLRWMHNTLIPLAAAFIADDGRIVNIVEMTPQTDDPHCSTRPVRFVLEMNGNWFCEAPTSRPATTSPASPSRVEASPTEKAAEAAFRRMRGAELLQAKLASAKDQFASEFRKVSTNFGRRLRWSM